MGGEPLASVLHTVQKDALGVCRIRFADEEGDDLAAFERGADGAEGCMGRIVGGDFGPLLDESIVGSVV